MDKAEISVYAIHYEVQFRDQPSISGTLSLYAADPDTALTVFRDASAEHIKGDHPGATAVVAHAVLHH